jgi:hypothetical protein
MEADEHHHAHQDAESHSSRVGNDQILGILFLLCISTKIKIFITVFIVLFIKHLSDPPRCLTGTVSCARQRNFSAISC